MTTDAKKATVWMPAAPELEPAAASEPDEALAASSSPDSLLPEFLPEYPLLSMERSSDPLDPLSESPTVTSSVLLDAAELKTSSVLDLADSESDEASLELPESLDPAEDAEFDVDADVEADSDEDVESEGAVVAISAADVATMARTNRNGVKNFIASDLGL